MPSELNAGAYSEELHNPFRWARQQSRRIPADTANREHDLPARGPDKEVYGAGCCRDERLRQLVTGQQLEELAAVYLPSLSVLARSNSPASAKALTGSTSLTSPARRFSSSSNTAARCCSIVTLVGLSAGSTGT